MIRTAAATACARHATVSHCRSAVPGPGISSKSNCSERHSQPRQVTNRRSGHRATALRPVTAPSPPRPAPENSMAARGIPTPPPAFSPTRFVWRLRATQTFSSLCRAPNYAERFRNDAPLLRRRRTFRGRLLCSIRHSLVAHSASRNASRRSLGRKRVRLPRSYGLSLVNADEGPCGRDQLAALARGRRR